VVQRRGALVLLVDHHDLVDVAPQALDGLVGVAHRQHGEADLVQRGLDDALPLGRVLADQRQPCLEIGAGRGLGAHFFFAPKTERL